MLEQQTATLAVIVVVLVLGFYFTRRLRRNEYTPWTPGPAEVADFAALQGNWRLVSMRRDGASVDSAPCVYTFQGDMLLVSPQGKPASEYYFRLEATLQPKTISIIARWATGKITGSDSAYELAGNQLRWCHVGGQRPTRVLPDDSPIGTIVKLRRMQR